MGNLEEKHPHLPGYKTPPVIEVVSGITFEKMERFKIPFFGRFWNNILKEFPSCENAPPLDFGKLIEDPVSGCPIPRVWYINESTDKLIQLQLNKFFFNWRKMQEAHIYPSFEKINEQFNEYLNIFWNFLAEVNLNRPNVLSCELTYINHIGSSEGYKKVEDIGRIFPDFVWRSIEVRFLKNPIHENIRFDFQLPEDKGQLLITLNSALRKIDKSPMLVLEITARGLGGDKSQKAIAEWFELAHEWIVKSFEDLTSQNIQKEVWRKYVRNE